MKKKDIRAHSATDLRYRLIAGRVSLAPLHVLRSREIEAHGWSIRFVILGASHAVVLERGDGALTELLTCMPPICNASKGNCFELAVPATPASCSLPAGLGIDGSHVSLELFPLREGDELEGVFGTNCRLELEFPLLGHKDPVSATPLTRIGWTLTSDGLIVETIHTYPEEATGVRSRTSFALAAMNAGESA